MVLFERIVEIPESDEIIDLAFRRARKAANTEVEGNPTRKARVREKKRIRVSSQVIRDRLDRILNGFPDPENLHPFNQKMIDILADENKIRRIRKSLNKSKEIIKKIEKEEIKKFGETQNPEKMTKVRNETYGRFSSVLNKLEDDLLYLKETKDNLKDLPQIDTEDYTVIIAGHPNVGKSTILKNLTNASPRVASFPFTTRKIILGHFKIGWRKFQVMDTPGLLDRPYKEMSKPEKQVLNALKELNSLIIYVFDPSEYCGFSKSEQIKLFKNLTNKFQNADFITIINKEDIVLNQESITDTDLRENLENIGYPPKFLIAQSMKGINIKDIIEKYFKKLNN